MKEVIYDKKIALVHYDDRREIYDPLTILDGLTGDWYQHNIITILENNCILGDHYHDYNEVFFTPTGGFYFILVDIDYPNKAKCFVLKKGSRILIPAYVAHRVICKKGSILIGFGSKKFDAKHIFKCNNEILSTFKRKSNFSF